MRFRRPRRAPSPPENSKSQATRRTWRKIHVGMCANSGQVVISAMTLNNVSDGEAMVSMMDSLEDVMLGDVIGDGAYDTIDCRDAVHGRGGRQVIPPDKNAKCQKIDAIAALKKRDRAIQRMEELGPEGRAIWKRETGYHRRSRGETLMFRLKTLLGDRRAHSHFLGRKKIHHRDTENKEIAQR